MATSQSQEILRNIDSILADIKWKGPPSDISHLQTPNHLASFKKLGNQEESTSQRITSHILTHPGSKDGNCFRVCSIGCEDGSLDRAVLNGVKEIKMEYIGLDNDDQLVDVALEQLHDISPQIEVSTLAVDYEDGEAVKQLKLKPFDVIWMANCTYYTSSLVSLIQGAFSLLKPAGELIIVSSKKESIEELVTRFWSHQRQDELHTAESVVATLKQLSIPHHISREPITLDLTAHLGENFSTKQSELVLDHLMLCRLTDYPPQVKDLVIKYLKSIATKNKIVSFSDFILLHKN